MHSITSTTRRTPVRLAALALASATLLAACASDSGSTTPTTPGATASTSAAPATGPVTLLTHSSYELSKEQIADLKKKGLDVKVVQVGDGGTLVNQLILTKDAPLGDVVFGIDNTFASRAIDAGVFEPYASPALPEAAAALKVAGGDAVTPVDQGDVCINVDSVWFEKHTDVPVPATLDDLTKPAYKDLVVLTNPATSTPGLSFLAGTVTQYGADGYLDYWARLKANGVRIAESWSDAYYTDFTSQGENGTRPIVLSYSSSPAFTLTDDGGTTTASLPATCTRQVEYAGVLAGAKNPAGARAVVDYLLSPELQKTLPDAAYMYPVDPDVALPEAFQEHGTLSENPIAVDPVVVARDRDTWIADWTDTVLG
ncbi:thiamine ABC transporter substrate-binding protein [Sanguibacter sp. HDW7]|uniref:thiamine ABC transporter substrate-binding protein n=1 Tax=Sanguibacter sp. HDW7 TaxID=2714931 RepID=UPI001F0D1529|nr:thiamine ABC transporter substrate-binding protein [Sanguibacter sp. HDW7]